MTLPLKSADFEDLAACINGKINDLPDKYKDTEIDDLDGFHELIELYKLNGMIAIHEVLKKMDEAGEFEELNYRNKFMFIIIRFFN